MLLLTTLVASVVAGDAPAPLIQDPLFDSAHDGEFVWHEVGGWLACVCARVCSGQAVTGNAQNNSTSVNKQQSCPDPSQTHR